MLLGVLGVLMLSGVDAAGQSHRRPGHPPTMKSTKRVPVSDLIARIHAMSPAPRVEHFGGRVEAARERLRSIPATISGRAEAPQIVKARRVPPVVVRAEPYPPEEEVRMAPVAAATLWEGRPPPVLRQAPAPSASASRAAADDPRLDASRPIESSALFPGQRSKDRKMASGQIAEPSLPERREEAVRVQWNNTNSNKMSAFLHDCHDLSLKGLKYKFGSNDPKKGGMDCSGTVQHLLMSQDIRSVPRQSNHQYAWLEKKGTLKKVGMFQSMDRVLRDLKPGDLLFWKDTYNARRHPNVTHVMVYLGWDRRSGKHKMFGARGSRASGDHGNAVDIFDFSYPDDGGKGKFIAYGSVPELQS
jgi:cell wall-associated NlpC family hydrolase